MAKFRLFLFVDYLVFCREYEGKKKKRKIEDKLLRMLLNEEKPFTTIREWKLSWLLFSDSSTFV